VKYLSLFSGIGGFELGIKNAYEKLYNSSDNTRKLQTEGKLSTKRKSIISKDSTSSDNEFQSNALLSCVGYSEIDKYAIQIYEKHFGNNRKLLQGKTTKSLQENSPNIEGGQTRIISSYKNYGDIKKINPKELPDFDLVVGGFPCQSFSIAGKRGGFADTRGTLFFDIARIIREKQPRLLLLENVKGLLSHDQGRTFTTIISTLDELGYDLQWQVLNSKNFGVPQNRERVFIIGHLRGTPRPEVFPFTSNSKQNSKIYKGEKQVAQTINTSIGRNQSDGQYINVVGTLETDGWEKRHEQIRRIHGTDGISPTIPTGTGGGVMTKIQIPEATKKGYAEAQEGDSVNLSVPNSKTRRGRVGKGIAQTVDTGMQQHTLQDAQIRRLTPTECERLQGFPDGWTEGVSDTQRYKTLGNAVTVNVIQAIMEKLK
jgi:DNA (cytosine-5)-methyltransferase 1